MRAASCAARVCQWHHRLPTRHLSRQAASVPPSASAGNVFAFAGQGSQFVGMGKDLHAEFGCAREVFEQVDEGLQSHLSRLMFSGDEADLRLTRNSQPAIVAHCAALLAVLRQELGVGVDSAVTRAVMGHSLGEFTAFAAAGSLSLPDTVRLVRFRGEEMQRCAPRDGGKMVALFPVRGGVDAVQQICVQSVAAHGGGRGGGVASVCGIANVNTAAQVVISGHTAAVDWAAARAKEAGVARRAAPLRTSAPFHCSLMAPAASALRTQLRAVLHGMAPEEAEAAAHGSGGGVGIGSGGSGGSSGGGQIHDPTVGVIANVSAQVVTTAAAVPENFFQQATQPVQWHKSMLAAQQLLQDGDAVFCVGPGTTLSTFFKSVGVDAWALHDVDSIRRLEAALTP